MKIQKLFQVVHQVRYADLGPHIGGAVLPADDGTFDIYINSREPDTIKDLTYLHELAHACLDHPYQDDKSEAQKEAEADEMLPFLQDALYQLASTGSLDDIQGTCPDARPLKP